MTLLTNKFLTKLKSPATDRITSPMIKTKVPTARIYISFRGRDRRPVSRL